MSNLKSFFTVSVLSAILAGQAMASVSDNNGAASKAPLELVPKELPLVPKYLGQNIRTYIFDLVAHTDSTDNNFFNHENRNRQSNPTPAVYN